MHSDLGDSVRARHHFASLVARCKGLYHHAILEEEHRLTEAALAGGNRRREQVK